MKSLLCTVLLIAGSLAIPVSQPTYTGQYVTAQAVQPQQYQPQYQIQYQPQQYRQISQAEFLAAYAQPTPTPQVHEPQPETQVQYQTAPQQYRNAQPLLGTVERQIQKAAQHVAGPVYAAQIANLQLQDRQSQAQAQVQRNALRLATAPRAQPLQYQRALQPTPSRHQLAEQGELPEQYNSNPSYQFGFDVKDDHYTNYQNRKEQREGDKITGSYSVVDPDGHIRTVTYTADPKEGFKAEVQRQPTDIVVKIPTPPTVEKTQIQYQPQQQPRYHAQPQYQAQSEYQAQPQIQYRQPQYIEVAASPTHSSQNQAEDTKTRYVYQYQ